MVVYGSEGRLFDPSTVQVHVEVSLGKMASDVASSGGKVCEWLKLLVNHAGEPLPPVHE